jgi:hypothetical protein
MKAHFYSLAADRNRQRSPSDSLILVYTLTGRRSLREFAAVYRKMTKVVRHETAAMISG